MATERAPGDDPVDDTPLLSRPLDEELRDPFGPVDGPATTRRRQAGPPPPAQSLLDAFGRSTGALLTPDPPPPTPADGAGSAPDEARSAAWSTGAAAPPVFAPPPPVGRQPSLAPTPRPIVEQPPLPPAAAPSPLAGAPALPSQVAFTVPPATVSPATLPPATVPRPPLVEPTFPAVPAEPTPVSSWLPPPPAAPSWVPPGARVPPGGGAPAWVPADAPPPAPRPPRPAGLVVAGIGVVVVVLLVFVAVVAVGALGGGSKAEAEGAPPAPAHPEAWDPRIDPIATWVADERDLEFTHPVEVVLQPEDEYLEQAAGDPAAPDEDQAQELEDSVAALRALGLVEGEVDLAGAVSDLSSEGTLAYYDPAEETVYVRGDELTPDVRVTLAHELTHVLQDQHFDLGRIGDPDFDRAGQLRAIAEGDAERIERAYADEVLTAAERDADETAQQDDTAESALADVPEVLSIIFAAPYTLGDGYLGYLTDVGSTSAYDEALEDPPSEQELLDPTIRGTARAEEPAVEVEAPDDAEVIDDTPFGPLGWYVLLASRGNAGAALEVVDGWGADASVTYRADGDVCTDLALVGDTPAATDRLYFALMSWVAAGPEDTAEVTRQGDVVELHACDPGADAASGSTVSTSLLSYPYLRADIEAGFVTESGMTAEQARCSSGPIITELTVAELTSPTLSAEHRDLVEQTVLECTR